MAGESPDKVERRESSGETTDQGGSVAPPAGKPSGKKPGKKPGTKGERKRSGGSGAAASRSAESSDEARDEAGGDASKTPSKGSGRNGRSAEAEAAPDAGDGDAGAESAGAEEAAGAGGGAEGHGRNDARLKAAVAAWVAGSDDEPDGEPDEADQDEAGAESAEDGEAVKDGTVNSPSGEKDSSQIPASDLPVRPRSDEGDAGDEGDGSGGEDGGSAESRRTPRASKGARDPKAPKASEASGGAEGAAQAAGEVDSPTAMFRTVRPGSDDSAAATDGEEAARRAERMTSAFFGAGKKTEKGAPGAESGKSESAVPATEEPKQAEKPAEKPEASEAPAQEGKTDASSGDGGTAQAEPKQDREPEPEPKSGPEPKQESKPEPEPEEPGGARGGKREPSAERVDEPTTAFRAPDPDAASKRSAGKRGTGRVDQPTAVFRTVDPDTADAAGGAGKAGEKTEPEAEAKSAKSAKSAKPVDPRLPAASEKPEPEKPEAGKPEPEKPEAGKPEPEKPEAGKPEPKKPETGKPGSEKPEPKKPEAEKPEAGKPEAGKPGAEPEAPAERESESERTSQFVPLRSTDAPPRPKHAPGSAPVVPPKPEDKPTTGEMPPEAEPERRLSEAELTRQQARPDQAPLDLLAQLTNTPPPPETPLRTAVRRVKIWTPLVALLAVLFVIAQAVRPLPDPELSLSADPTYSFQGAKPSVPWPSEGQAALDVQGLGSFGSSGKQKPVPIASVAKVMTAYVILRDHPVKKGTEGKKIPVDKKAEDEAGLSAQNESTVEVNKGDTLSQKEAVEAVMIASANNVARLLARWDAGSEKAFAKKMNAAAKDLGMKNTKYTDPSGLTSSTVSTATDQVKLGKKAMDIDLFRETVRLPGYKDAKGEQHGNWNKLVPLDGVVGVKTGTTTKAGGNLLFAAEKKVGGTEQLIIGAVLGQYQPSILDTVLAESKKLIDTAQDSLRAQKVVEKGEVVGYVDDRLGGRTPVVASRDVSAVGWSGLKVKLGLTDSGKALPHEGKAGDRAGTLTVGDGPGQVRVPVRLKEDMSEPGFGAKLTRIL